MKLLLATVAPLVVVAVTEDFVNTLETRTECQNLDEILTDVGYTNYKKNPYPEYDPSTSSSEGGYDTDINKDVNCYIHFLNPEARTNTSETINYELLSITPDEAAAKNDTSIGTVYLSHMYECGACSTMDQLGVYLEYEDLTTPVSKCMVKDLIPFFGKKLALECLAKLGFKDSCQYIWYYNGHEDAGLCTGICMQKTLLKQPNNVEVGMGKNYCEPWAENATFGCKNKINGANACEWFQWVQGQEYRLHPCLQCDECRGGPIFQKKAGRTRRNSGLESAILRPDPVHILHYYGIPSN